MIIHGDFGLLPEIHREFSKIVNLITSLQKKQKRFVWDEKCEESFNKLKELL